MDPKLVAVVMLSCLCIAGIEAGGGSTSGKFEWNGRLCQYSELGEKGSHDRTLRVGCKGNAKKKIPQLSCQYGGDPHPCHWYNQDNQGNFYRCLVNDLISKGGDNLCSPGSISCAKKCPDEVFVKRSNIFRELMAMAKIDERVHTYEQESYDQEDLL